MIEMNSEQIETQLNRFKHRRNDAKLIEDPVLRNKELEEIYVAERAFRNSSDIYRKIDELREIGLVKSEYLFGAHDGSEHGIEAIYVLKDEIAFSDRDGVITFLRDDFDISDAALAEMVLKKSGTSTIFDVMGWPRTEVYEVYRSKVDESFFVTNSVHRDSHQLRCASIELLKVRMRDDGWTHHGICFRWDDKPVDMWERNGEFVAAWVADPTDEPRN